MQYVIRIWDSGSEASWQLLRTTLLDNGEKTRIFTAVIQMLEVSYYYYYY
jgi:hypothetical protein